MNVAVLGTGLMGRPIAERLIAAGHKVVVYNRTPAKAKPLAKLGAKVAKTPSDAMRRAEVIVTMLADAAAIETTLLGSTAPDFDGKTVIQMGTIGPRETRAFQHKVTNADGDYIECPVLGSREEAQNGTLILMFGGTRSQFDQWAPFLEAVGRTPIHIGPVGQAAALKLALNQMIAGLGSTFILSLAFVQEIGIDRETFMDILRKSALMAPMFDKKLPRLLTRDFSNPNFPVKWMLKDVKLFLNEAKALGLRIDALEGIRTILEDTMQKGLSEGDYVALSETIKKENVCHAKS